MIHRVLYNLWRSDNAIPDPGAGNTITISHQFATVPVVTAGAEARTLRQPTKAGHYCLVHLEHDGGDLTLTVAGGYDSAGQTTITFGDVGDWVQFVSIEEDGSFYWRVMNATAGVAEISAELSEVIAATTFTVQIGSTDQVVFNDGAIIPSADDDIDLGSPADQFKNAYFSRIVEAAEFFNADLVLNSTNVIYVQLAGVNLLAIDNAAIASNAALSNTAGLDVYIETTDGGAATTGNTGADGGAHSLKTGDGSQGFDTENEDGADAGDITRTGGDGGRAGLLAAGTANGGVGGSITDVAGDGGDGGVGSGTDGDGGDYSVDAGSPGSGGSTPGTAGVVLVGATNAESVTIGRTGKTTTINGPTTIDTLSPEHGAGFVPTLSAPLTSRRSENGVIITEIKFDLDGLHVTGTAAKDVIGLVGAASSYFGRYVVADYGIVYRIEMICTVLPTEQTATITLDLDIGADDQDLAQDASADDVVINTGGIAAGNMFVNNTPALTPNDYLYLIEGDTAATTGEYSGGQIIVRFYGHPVMT